MAPESGISKGPPSIGEALGSPFSLVEAVADIKETGVGTAESIRLTLGVGMAAILELGTMITLGDGIMLIDGDGSIFIEGDTEIMLCDGAINGIGDGAILRDGAGKVILLDGAGVSGMKLVDGCGVLLFDGMAEGVGGM